MGGTRCRDCAPSLVHVPDGRRRDVGARSGDDARAGPRRPARRRCVRLPLRHEREHLRADDDGGGEGRRPDPREHAARAGADTVLPASARFVTCAFTEGRGRLSCEHERVAAFYAAVADLQVVSRGSVHILLERAGFRVIVVAIPDAIARTTRSRIACETSRHGTEALVPRGGHCGCARDRRVQGARRSARAGVGAPGRAHVRAMTPRGT